MQRFDYASRHQARCENNSCVNIECDWVIKEKRWDVATIKSSYLGEVRLIDRSWILANRITIRMNMDKHEGETMH